MRILLLTQYYPPEVGAAQARLEYYANHFAGEGHDVSVVTPPPNYPGGLVYPGHENRLFAEERRGGVRVVRTWLWQAAGSRARSRLKGYASFMLSSLLGAARVERPDVVLVETPPLFLGLSALAAGAWFRAPVVTHLSDLWVDAALDFGFLKRGWPERLARRLERQVLGSSSGIVGVTERVRDHALRFLAPERVALVPNGVDTDLYRPVERDPALAAACGTAGRFVAVYAGTLGYVHGLDVLVDAAALLSRSDPDVLLLVIGDGSEKARLVEIARARGLANVTFLPLVSQSDLVRHLALADVGVSTLKPAEFTRGALPVKMLSYMAAGLPVVGTDLGDSGDLLSASGGGLGVPPGDARALAEAIRSLKRSPGLGASLGRNGRRYVAAHRSRAEMASLLLDFLGHVRSLDVAARRVGTGRTNGEKIEPVGSPPAGSASAPSPSPAPKRPLGRTLP